jgi:tetratricopeptide (TPR) repeat protein
VDETEILDLLGRIVRKSMVVVQDRGGIARYSLLETIRQYGWEKLSDAGESQLVRDRQCRWFLQLAEQAEAEFRGRKQSAAFARLELEHDNLRAALAWSTDQPDGDAALRLTSAMGYFWRQHGYYSEGLAWLKRALELPTGANTLRGRALLWASALALELADYSAADRYGAESVASPKEGGGHWELGFAQHILGSIAFRMDEMEQAAQFWRSSFTAFQQAGTTWGRALGYQSLGLLSWATGDYERALENADEGLRLFRLSGDDEQVASSLRLLGSVHLTMGNFNPASAVLQECLALFERLGAKRSVAHANNDLGILARIRGDLEQAKAFHTASLEGFRRLNAHQAAGYALVELALLALTEKDFASALATIDESLTIFRDVKDRAGIVKCLECRAAIELQEPYRAAMLLGAAQSLRESIQNPIEPYLRGWRESIAITASEALGTKEYDVAYSEGASRSLDEIVRFCLEGGWPQTGSTGSREEPKPLIAGHPRNNSGR